MRSIVQISFPEEKRFEVMEELRGIHPFRKGTDPDLYAAIATDQVPELRAKLTAMPGVAVAVFEELPDL